MMSFYSFLIFFLLCFSFLVTFHIDPLRCLVLVLGIDVSVLPIEKESLVFSVCVVDYPILHLFLCHRLNISGCYIKNQIIKEKIRKMEIQRRAVEKKKKKGEEVPFSLMLAQLIRCETFGGC